MNTRELRLREHPLLISLALFEAGALIALVYRLLHPDA